LHKLKLRNEKSIVYLRFLLIAYFIVVSWLLFYQVGSTERESYFQYRTIHLIPFESTYHSLKLAITNNFGPPHKAHYRYITARNIIGNLLLFFPWGILAPLSFYYFQSLTKVLFSTIILSASAELLQFILVIGVADVDDVIFNTIGAFIGFHVCLAFQKTIKRHRKQEEKNNTY